jgi:hypothetical protein
MANNKSYLLVLSILLSTASYAIDCSNFNGEMGCSSGQATNNPADWS